MQQIILSNKLGELGSEVHEESSKIPYDALVISNKKLKESLFQLKDKKNKEIDVIVKSLIDAQFRSQSLLIEIDECKNYINSYNKDIIIKSKAIKSIVSSIDYKTKTFENWADRIIDTSHRKIMNLKSNIKKLSKYIALNNSNIKDKELESKEKILMNLEESFQRQREYFNIKMLDSLKRIRNELNLAKSREISLEDKIKHIKAQNLSIAKDYKRMLLESVPSIEKIEYLQDKLTEVKQERKAFKDTVNMLSVMLAKFTIRNEEEEGAPGAGIGNHYKSSNDKDLLSCVSLGSCL